MKNVYYILPLVALALLTATTAGWLRLSWAIPVSVNAGEHGAMMVGSFLGALISLERAVVIKKRWAYLAPLLAGVSTFFFLTHLSFVAYMLLSAASLAYVIMLYHLYLKHAETHMLVMIGGALCWLIGNLILLKYHLYPLSVSWWIGFLLFTIAGERLELSRFLPNSRIKSISFLLATGLFLLGLLLPFHGIGRMVFGSGLVFTGIWLYRYDIARISIKKEGLTRFVAAALLCGYFWLFLCGSLSLLSDFYYDAVLHSFFIGFVFSMIFAHGPIILPGIMKLSVKPYHPILYVWLLGLQLGLMVRITGSLAGIYEWQRWGGMANGLIIFAYLISMGTIVIRQSLKKKAVSKATKKCTDMKDIEDMEDVRLMVDMFYQKVNQDAMLSPVFNEVAKVDWLAHMPKMYRFWGTLLLGEASYKGSPFDKHLPLPIDSQHFDRWMALFVETIDENFSGNKAEEAKQKAQSIAGIFSFKMKTIKAL